MALCKAAGVIYTRTLIKAKGDKIEQLFLDQLTEKEAALYHTVMPISMLPLETAMKLYKIAVPLVYTGSNIEDGLVSLAYDTAKNNMRGIYKILVRFFSPETVIKQTAKIWKTYHSKGIAVSEQVSQQHARLTLMDYTDVPDGFEYIMVGFIRGLIDLTGARNVRVLHDISNRDALKWDLYWE